MREELDNYLCRKYPKIFKNRHADMTQTCMCWGFEIGDGWFNIIDATCRNIQSHIDWSRKNRSIALRYNRALQRALDGNTKELFRFYSGLSGKITEYTSNSVTLAMSKREFRVVEKATPQVVAVQVKEKFGTLRFYVDGGDDCTRGMIRIAEAMSGVMCEECGAPGRSTTSGWIQTLCEKHAEERNATLVPKREF